MEADLDLLERIRRWLQEEEGVRAALLTGSRAVDGSPVDELSDFDVLLFLEPDSRLLQDEGWWEELGTVLVMLPETGTLLDRPTATRLVQYRGGGRVDFGLARVEILEELVEGDALPPELDAGYRVLLDRDGLAERLPAPTGAGHVPRRPDQDRFASLVNEFWWETLYVAKYLSRGEVLPARYSHEVVIRYRCLIPMLEWRVQVGRGWRVSVGLNGRGLPELLDPEDRQELEESLTGSNLEETWHGLEATMALFRRAGRVVAEDLGYAYPRELDRDVTARIRQVRDG